MTMLGSLHGLCGGGLQLFACIVVRREGLGGGGGWCTHRPFAKATPIIMSVCSTLSSNVQLLHLEEGGGGT